MENMLDRRGLLGFIGMAGITGLVGGCGGQSEAENTSNANPGSSTPRTVQSFEHTFLVDPGVTREIDGASGAVIRESFWAVPKEMQAAVPMLTRSFVPDLVDIQDFSEKATQGQIPTVSVRGVAGDPTAALMGVTLSGVPDVMDIASNTALAVIDGDELDLSLAFLHRGIDQSTTPITRATRVVSGLPVEDLGEQAITRANPPPPGITLYGWKLQFRGPDTHEFGKCLAKPVTHYNVDVHRQQPNGSFTPVLNFHLGTYRDGSRRCFVLWESERLKICWKTCSPTQQDLVQIVKYMLTAAAAIVGVAIAAWIVAAIAEAAAAVLFIPLLLLA